MEFDKQFVLKLVATMLRSREHSFRIATALDCRLIDDNVLADVAEVTAAYVKKYKDLPTRELIRQECGKDVATSPLFNKLWKQDISDAAWVADKTTEYCRLQAVKAAIIAGADDLRLRNDSSQLLRRVQEALQVGVDYANLGDRLSDLDARAARYLHGDVMGEMVPTGWAHIDSALKGGLAKGCIGAIMGPAGSGKTWALMNIGRNAISKRAAKTDADGLTVGNKVVHYSFEVRTSKLMERYDKRVGATGVNKAAGDGKKIIEHLRRWYAITNTRDADVFVKYASTETFTTDDIRVHLDALRSVHGYKPDLILVDYPGIMKSVRGKGERVEDLPAIWRELRGIAGDYNAALWGGLQATSASAGKKTLRKSDTAFAGEVQHILDVCLTICQTEAEKGDSRMRLFLAKSRDTRDSLTFTGTADFDATGGFNTDGVQTAVPVSEGDSESAIDRNIHRAMHMAARRDVS